MQQFFQFLILTFFYSSTCFGHFPAHHQELTDCSGSLWFYLRIVMIALLCSWSGRNKLLYYEIPSCIDIHKMCVINAE